MRPAGGAGRTMPELWNRKLRPTPANDARIYGAFTGGDAMTAAGAIEWLCVRMPDGAAAGALHQAIRGDEGRSAGEILEEALNAVYVRVHTAAESAPTARASDVAQSIDTSLGLITAGAPPTDTQVTRRLASALLRVMKDIDPPVTGRAALRARERVLHTRSTCEDKVVAVSELGSPSGNNRPARHAIHEYRRVRES